MSRRLWVNTRGIWGEIEKRNLVRVTQYKPNHDLDRRLFEELDKKDKLIAKKNPKYGLLPTSQDVFVKSEVLYVPLNVAIATGEFQVRFEPSERDSTLMAKINGKPCFPDKGGAKPLPGEVWTVESISQNPRGTVYFAKLKEKIEV